MTRCSIQQQLQKFGKTLVTEVRVKETISSEIVQSTERWNTELSLSNSLPNPSSSLLRRGDYSGLLNTISMGLCSKTYNQHLAILPFSSTSYCYHDSSISHSQLNVYFFLHLKIVNDKPVQLASTAVTYELNLPRGLCFLKFLESLSSHFNT